MSKLKCCPTEYEVYDDFDDLIVKIKTFDEYSVEVNIKGVQSMESWKELSESVEYCIQQMIGD